MGRDGESVDGLGSNESSGGGTNEARGHDAARSSEGRLVSDEVRQIEAGLGDLAELVPHIQVGCNTTDSSLGTTGLVLSRAQTDKHALNRPLEILEQDLIIREGCSNVLLTVDADEGKSDTLDENLVNLQGKCSITAFPDP